MSVLSFKEHPARNLSFILLFIITLIFFQLNRMTIAFLILFTLLLLVAFLKEKQRLFVWMSIAYFFGELLYLYGNRFISGLSYHVNILLMLDKLLLLLPIIMILYVCHKFKQDVTVFFKKTDWNRTVSFPVNGFRMTISRLLMVAIMLTIVIYLPFIIAEAPKIQLPWLFWIVIYAAITSMMEELLWRGLMIAGMNNITNEGFAILFSSVAYGFSNMMFGYSFSICLLVAFFGCFWGYITLRSGSIIPAMVWHFVFQIVMILSGAFPYLPI